MKKQECLKWDDFFLSICYVCAMRSKDPNTKVGACIVDYNNRIVSTGYNGLPINLNDKNFSWDNRDKNDVFNNKYTYVIHAETNAILFSNRNLKDCKLYVTLFPCSLCVKLLIQSEIKTVFYVDDTYNGTPDNLAAKRMLKEADVKIQKLDGLNVSITKYINNKK